MKNTVLKYYIAACYLCSTFVTFAQPGTEDDSGSGNLEGTDGLPINDYLWVLVILGLLFVFFKFRALQKANTPLK